MGTRRDRAQASGGSDLLTVLEAADRLRVGRTKAYLMAQEWRATGGRSGLPVVELGNVLRVPRHALEEMIGAKLTDPAPAVAPDTAGDDGDRRESTPPRPAASRPRSGRRSTRRPRTTTTRAPKNATANQLDLFDATD